MLKTSVRYIIIKFWYTCETDGYSREAGGGHYWYYSHKTEVSCTHDNLCIFAGLLRIKNRDSYNIYEYYCNSTDQINQFFAKTYKSDNTYRDIARS
jgi:hypothetical protein